MSQPLLSQGSQASVVSDDWGDDDWMANVDLDGIVSSAHSGGPSSQPPATSSQPPTQPQVGSDGISRDAEWTAITSTNLEPGQLMKIEAAAGAGKSTVLREYAAYRPHLKTLYLTFGKDVQLEKEREFDKAGLRHVKVSTLCSLAYGQTKHIHRGQVKGDLWLKSQHVQGLTGRAAGDEMLGAIKEVFSIFCASTDAAIGPSHLPATAAYHTAMLNDGEVLHAAQQLWDALADPSRNHARDAPQPRSSVYETRVHGNRRLPDMSHEMYTKLLQLDPARQVTPPRSRAISPELA